MAGVLGGDWRTHMSDTSWSQSNAIAQPLVTGASLAAWAALAPGLPRVVAVAGYSVGELAACVAAGKPLVSGALGRWNGQVGVFAGRPCYQCLTPEIPPDAETCSRVGVVGALAGVIGSMAALEVIKLITGAGEPLTGRLLLYDGLAGTARTVRVGADPNCPICGG